MALRLKANRRFPSLPVVTADTNNHTQVLMAVKEALDIGQRRTGDLLNSFIRVEDLIDLGLITIEGNTNSIVGADLSEIADIGDLSGAATGDFLRFDGTEWVNDQLSPTDITQTMVTQHEAALSIAYSQITGTPSIPSDLDDLTDVDLSTPPVLNDVLTFDGASWVAEPASGGALYLDDLLDVDAMYPADGDVLRFDGTEWVPDPFGTGDLSLNISSFFSGVPSSGALVFAWTSPDTRTLLGNFSGSVGHVGTSPSSSTQFSVSVNGSSVGTITVSTAGAVVFATTGGAQVNLVAGDRLTITAPTPTNSIADLAFTLLAEQPAGNFPTKTTISFFMPGTAASSQLVAKAVVARTFYFPANFADSYGDIGANPTSTWVLSVSINGASAGTITVSTGGAFTFATTGGVALNLSAGDVVEIEAPSSADGTAADASVTLVGLFA